MTTLTLMSRYRLLAPVLALALIMTSCETPDLPGL